MAEYEMTLEGLVVDEEKPASYKYLASSMQVPSAVETDDCARVPVVVTVLIDGELAAHIAHVKAQLLQVRGERRLAPPSQARRRFPCRCASVWTREFVST